MKCSPCRCFRIVMFAVILVWLTGITIPLSAQDTSCQYIGEIRLWSGAREPKGWMFCDGRALKVADWQALFSIIGFNYGGDNQNTFNIPDLRGRLAMHSVDSNTQITNSRFLDFTGTLKSLDKSGAPLYQGRNYVALTSPTDGKALSVTPPYLALNYIICVNGLYPCRE
ncbi:MAG: hypothetical protein EOM80_01580 [Erysipelotrichia bacterium]|nr:hypothetical protein [Erysipelotrichia bacterium]